MTDWLAYWHELALSRSEGKQKSDYWCGQARSFSDRVEQRWQKPDSTRSHIIQTLVQNPGSSLLDVGAGTGNWAIAFSPYAQKITALEPSAGMREIMAENIVSHSPPITNIEMTAGRFEDVEFLPHDFLFCSHAMYGIPDFRAMIQKMINLTRSQIFLLIRAPMLDDPLVQLSLQIHGTPHDSPNFAVAYQALMQMGIYANVLFEERKTNHKKRFDSVENAFDTLKKRFRLAPEDDRFDNQIRASLRYHLREDDQGVSLDASVRSALIYWNR